MKKLQGPWLRATRLLIACGTFSVLISGCATWAGKPPPCPPPSSIAVGDLEWLVRADIEDPGRFSAILNWVGEIERYCSGIKAMINA